MFFYLYNELSGTATRRQFRSYYPIHLSDVFCSGQETSVFQCSLSTKNSGVTCQDGSLRAAAVICEGNARHNYQLCECSVVIIGSIN